MHDVTEAIRTTKAIRVTARLLSDSCRKKSVIALTSIIRAPKAPTATNAIPKSKKMIPSPFSSQGRKNTNRLIWHYISRIMRVVLLFVKKCGHRRQCSCFLFIKQAIKVNITVYMIQKIEHIVSLSALVESVLRSPEK